MARAPATAGSCPTMLLLKKALEITVLLLSIGISILYFIYHKEKFPAVADKVTFFAGIIATRIIIIQVLM